MPRCPRAPSRSSTRSRPGSSRSQSAPRIWSSRRSRPLHRGKRLRPLLLVLSAGMGEPGEEELLGAATAIEVLHTATLIHDDIVDRAESRRGVPTTVAGYGRRSRPPRETTCSPRLSRSWRGSGTRGSCEPSPTPRWGSQRGARAVPGERGHGRRRGVPGAHKEEDRGPLPGRVRGRRDAWRALDRADRRARQLRPGAGIAFQMSDDIMDLVGKPGLMGKGIGTDLVEAP